MAFDSKPAAALRRIYGVLVLLTLIAAPLLAQGGGDKTKLEKRRTELKDQISKEEGRLGSKKDAAAAEFKKLSAADTLAKLAEGAAQLANQHKGDFSEEKEEATKAAVRKQAGKLLREQVGPILGPILEGPVAEHVAESVLLEEGIDGEKIMKAAIEQAFGTDGFDAAFDTAIKKELSKALKELARELATVERQLDDLSREELARKAGVPQGMVPVPGGNYRIGINAEDLEGLAKKLGYSNNIETLYLQWRSTPAHEVQVEPFFIDLNEVTCTWYAAYLKEHPKATVPKEWKDGKMPEGWANRPVTNLSYFDALKFARWMGRRLPLEEEWEAAARYTDSPKKELRIWSWGDDWDLRQIRCNFEGAVDLEPRRAIPPGLPPMLPVGTFPEGRSFLGINDLVGNAYEMTSSPFRPYKGFKDVAMKSRRVSSADFNENDIVLRGGDASKRDVIVTTVNRLGMPPGARSSLVGFRTARSQTRGKDHLDFLLAESGVKQWLVDYPPLPSDHLAGRRAAELDLGNPSSYYSVIAGGWDPVANVPAAARFITLARRIADDFRDLNTLKALSRDTPDQTTMLGYVHLDVAVEEPALDPGDYFLLWQNTNAPTEIAAASAPGGEKDKVKKGSGKPLEKAPTTKSDAFVFQRRGGTAAHSTRVESFNVPVVADAQSTKILPNAAANTVELVLAFPIKFHQNKSFVASVTLKLKAGEAAELK